MSVKDESPSTFVSYMVQSSDTQMYKNQSRAVDKPVQYIEGN